MGCSEAPYLDKRLPHFRGYVGQLHGLLKSLRQAPATFLQHAGHSIGRTGTQVAREAFAGRYCRTRWLHFSANQDIDCPFSSELPRVISWESQWPVRSRGMLVSLPNYF